MRPPRPRPTPRRAPAGVLAVALLTLASALGPVTASAAPTPAPTPTSGPSPSTTPAPTPTATSATGARPSPTASSSATPSPKQPPRDTSPTTAPTPRRTTAVPTAPAPAVPALLRRAADGHRLTRQAARAVIRADPRYEVLALSTCVTADELGQVSITAGLRGDGDNPEVELFYGAPGTTSPTGFATLTPGASRRVGWTVRSFRWVADASDPAGITESAGEGDLTVPQDCPGTGTGSRGAAVPSSAPGTGHGLADTGGPVGGLVVLAGALALTVAGAGLLVRERRRS